MRYSILGFNQEKVLSLFAIIGKKENGDYIYAKLDTEDLLILNLLADFPNRSSVIKRMIDDKVFFWASYDEIINELPILNIKKQALANRFDKLVLLGIVERKYIAIDARHQNSTFFTLTNVYESLLYQKEGCRSQILDGIVVKYDTLSNSQILDVYNNIDNNNIVDNKEKEIDKSIPKKEEIDYDNIVKCWNNYNGLKWGKVERLTDKRKRMIKRLMEDNKITHTDITRLFSTLPYADSWLFNPSKEHKNWKPTFDWFINNTNGWFTRALEGQMHQTNSKAFKDIMSGEDVGNCYTPEIGGSICYNEQYKCYMLIGGFYDETISDGYTDEERPNGARMMLNNGRGFVNWNSKTKKWEHE